MSTVTEYLADHELEFLAFDHNRTETAIEEARALGVAPGEVAKTILLDTPAGHVLAVIPASRRLDKDLVALAMGKGVVELATESEIESDLPGYELGAIPPLAGLLGMHMYVDSELATHKTVIFASGKQTESVKMRTADLIAEERVTVAPLCEREPAYDEDWME
jgi:prolyl-tRNA editing enzyme YbaK/EbsC (Cys-tRNA(Pro) deacylase)